MAFNTYIYKQYLSIMYNYVILLANQQFIIRVIKIIILLQAS